jgi:septum formation protein
MTEDLILASASVTRAQLLTAAGLEFQVEPAAINEETVKHAFRAACRTAIDCALELAELKAQRIAERHHRALVIGADQILVCGDVWFDKPPGFGAARAQLRALRGCTHELATAVCVVQAGIRIWHTLSEPKLTMRRFSNVFLDAYLEAEGASVLGSVGAYRLEGRGVQLFERIEGDHFAILGLPVLDLLRFLRSRGDLLS